jgi:hypothetical protein
MIVLVRCAPFERCIARKVAVVGGFFGAKIAQAYNQNMETVKVAQEINQGEIALAYLERTCAEWAPHYQRAIRDDRMNAELNAEADAFVPKLDRLLDELNAIGYYAIANA